MKRTPPLTMLERSNKALLLVVGLLTVLILFVAVAVKAYGPWIQGGTQPLSWRKVYIADQHRWLASDVKWSVASAPFVLNIKVEGTHLDRWDFFKGAEQFDFKSLCGAVLSDLPRDAPFSGPKEIHRRDIQSLIISLAQVKGRQIDVPITDGACGTPEFWVDPTVFKVFPSENSSEFRPQILAPPVPRLSSVPVATYFTEGIEWNFSGLIWHSNNQGYSIELKVLNTLSLSDGKQTRINFRHISALCHAIVRQLPGGLVKQVKPDEINQVIIVFSGRDVTFGVYNRGDWRRVLTSDVKGGDCQDTASFSEQKTIE